MMRFIVDAQLPVRLCRWLCDAGYDSIHTLHLPQKNLTDDVSIAEFADESGRIVISKDGDFTKLKLISGKPRSLLVVKTGNLNNRELIKLFETNLPTIEKLFESFEIVELSKTLVGGGNLK